MTRGDRGAEVLWDSRDKGGGPCDQDVLKVCQVLTPTGVPAKH